MRRVVVNSIGQEKERLATQEAISGKQILLTIDYDLQEIAEQSLGRRPGAAVALDPRTGEVLAMVSHPALDANDFAVVSRQMTGRVSTKIRKSLYSIARFRRSLRQARFSKS